MRLFFVHVYLSYLHCRVQTMRKAWEKVEDDTF